MQIPATHAEVAGIRTAVLDLPGWFDVRDEFGIQNYPSGTPIPTDEVAEPLCTRFGVTADNDNGGYWLRASRSTVSPREDPRTVSLHLERRTTEGGLDIMQYDFGTADANAVEGAGNASVHLIRPDDVMRIVESFGRTVSRIALRGEGVRPDDIARILDMAASGEVTGLAALIESSFEMQASGLTLPTGELGAAADVAATPETVPPDVDPVVSSEEVAALSGLVRHLRSVR